ncbi:MAG: hypothetical protein AAF587_44470, partial [Bacteroidota bacterium]
MYIWESSSTLSLSRQRETSAHKARNQRFPPLEGVGGGTRSYNLIVSPYLLADAQRLRKRLLDQIN